MGMSRKEMKRLGVFLTTISLFLYSCASLNTGSENLLEPDACLQQIPLSLVNSLKQLFPEYRIVSVSDYLNETIEKQKQYNYGNECLSLTIGDFDGNGEVDYVFLVTNGSRTEKLIAARSAKNDFWIIDKLLDFKNNSLGTSYVYTIPPGIYEDMGGGREESGRVGLYSSNKEGILTGTIESSGTAYFFSEDRWIHLWLFD